VTELADQGKMDDSSENSIVPKIIIEQTPYSSAHSDDSGLGGESNATMDGKLYHLKQLLQCTGYSHIFCPHSTKSLPAQPK